jgi:hypothetical protein
MVPPHHEMEAGLILSGDGFCPHATFPSPHAAANPQIEPVRRLVAETQQSVRDQLVSVALPYQLGDVSLHSLTHSLSLLPSISGVEAGMGNFPSISSYCMYRSLTRVTRRWRLAVPGGAVMTLSACSLGFGFGTGFRKMSN